MIRTVLTMIAATILWPGALNAQTVDEVIAKNILAHGGMEKIKSIHTIRVSGKFIVGNFRAAFLIENQRPDKVREEEIVQGFAEMRAYDGKTGWQVSPFEGRKDPELLSTDDMKGLIEDADIDGQLVDFQRKGHKAELVGHDSVEGTDCYKIKLTLKNGDIKYYYLDADSFVELKIESQRIIRGAPQESEIYFGDYEEVNGLYFPFVYEAGEKGSPERAKYTVEKIEMNVPLDDSLFSMPQSSPPGKSK